MFFSILKWVIISLTLIFLIHHLYMFLMNTLTVPKIKDLVNKPMQQYQDMLGGGAPTPPLGDMGGLHLGDMGGLHLGDMGGQGGTAPLSDELSSFLSDLKKNNAVSLGSNAVSLGPNAVSLGSLGPNAVSLGSLGPTTTTDKFPSTLGSLGGEMGYSLY
jgi:hypothetical protein